MSTAEFRGTDRFTIQRRLGAGGFGVVYEAHDNQKDSVVALKTLRHFTPESLYRFKREFRSLADIAHPNLVQLYELVSDSDEWFFTMELVHGRNFLEHVWAVPPARTRPQREHRPQSDVTEPALMATVAMEDPENFPDVVDREPAAGTTPADLDRLTDAFRQLVTAVDALHRNGNIHRDLKPSNVLVAPNGRLVLLDFGLVMDIDSDATLQSLQIAGTPAYMSPEQAAGLPLTAASDWYSAGVILYQALTGKLPFEGSFLDMLHARQRTEPLLPGHHVAGVPQHLDMLCRDLLRRDEASRPGAGEILARLDDPSWRSARAPMVRTSAAPRTPFVGRQKELKTLSAALADMVAGAAVTVALHGLSGIGKTSLARAFLDQTRVEHPDAVILTGRCYERESVPYKGVDNLIDALARYLRRLPAKEAEALLPRDAFALSHLFPVLRQIEERVASRRRMPAVPDEQELRRRSFAALRDLLGRIADQSPAVLFVDDLQWGDVDSADLLKEVLRDPGAPPLLFVACYRSDEVESSPFLRAFLTSENRAQLNIREVHVGQLSASESQQLAEALLQSSAPRFTQIAARIAAEAGGSPFFIDELVRAAEAAEGLGDAGAPRTIDTDERETTLSEMIQLRLARLPDDALRLLRLVAMNGQPVPALVLKRAGGVESHESALATLRTGHLIRTRETDGDDELETYHDRIREAVVRNVPEGLAPELHRALAYAHQAFAKGDPEALAEHFLAAGDEQAAIRYTIVAAENAERALAFDGAARLYRRALELLGADAEGRDELQVKLGNTLANAGRGAESAAAYLAVAGLPLHERLEIRRKAAQQLLFSGHIDEGLTVVHGVLSSVGMRLPETRRRTLLAFLLGRLRLRLRGLGFKPRNEEDVPRELLMRADTCWSVAVGLGIVDTMRGAVFQTLGLLDALESGELRRVIRAMCMELAYVAVPGSATRRQTAKLIARTRALCEQAPTPYSRGLLKLCEGVAAYLDGRWRLGADLCLEAEQILLDGCTGVTWEVDSSRFFSLWCQFYLGEMATIVERYPVLVKDAQERGDLYALTMFRGFLSHYIYLAADNPVEGRELSHDATRRWSQAGFHVQHMWELWAACDIAIYERRGSLAWTKIQQTWSAMKVALLFRIQFTHVAMLDLRGRSALAAVDEGVTAPEERRRLMGEAARAARKLDRQRTEYGSGFAEMLRVGLELLGGDRDGAVRRLEAVERKFDASDMHLHVQVARRRRGELLGGENGRALIAESEEWMLAQGLRNPERLTYVYAPWRTT